MRRSWCNDLRLWKSNQWPECKSYARLRAFTFALMPFRKAWIHFFLLFPSQSYIVGSDWFSYQSRRRKTLNLNQKYSAKNCSHVTPCLWWRGWANFIHAFINKFIWSSLSYLRWLGDTGPPQKMKNMIQLQNYTIDKAYACGAKFVWPLSRALIVC